MRRFVGRAWGGWSSIVVVLTMASSTVNILCNPFSPLEYLRWATRPGPVIASGVDDGWRPMASDVDGVADLDEVLALPSRDQSPLVKPLPFVAALPTALAWVERDGSLTPSTPRGAPVPGSWRFFRLRC